MPGPTDDGVVYRFTVPSRAITTGTSWYAAAPAERASTVSTLSPAGDHVAGASVMRFSVWALVLPPRSSVGAPSAPIVQRWPPRANTYRAAGTSGFGGVI